MTANKTKGLNQTSIAPSRIFRTLSLRSSKRQKNRSKQTSGWIPLSKSFACWESLNPWRQSTHPISCRGQQESSGPIICLPYLQMQMSPGINSRQHLGGHHISLGLMRMKAAEFMKLTQGTKILTEYMHAFNNLSRYAPEFVDTEAKKIESFKRGLSSK